MSKAREREFALIWIIEAVDRALEEYDASTIFVVRNPETAMFDVVYFDGYNSFAVESNVSNPAYICRYDVEVLAREMQARHVSVNQ